MTASSRASSRTRSARSASTSQRSTSSAAATPRPPRPPPPPPWRPRRARATPPAARTSSGRPSRPAGRALSAAAFAAPCRPSVRGGRDGAAAPRRGHRAPRDATPLATGSPRTRPLLIRGALCPPPGKAIHRHADTTTTRSCRARQTRMGRATHARLERATIYIDIYPHHLAAPTAAAARPVSRRGRRTI